MITDVGIATKPSNPREIVGLRFVFENGNECLITPTVALRAETGLHFRSDRIPPASAICFW
jgi:hypothetical protein